MPLLERDLDAPGRGQPVLIPLIGSAITKLAPAVLPWIGKVLGGGGAAPKTIAPVARETVRAITRVAAPAVRRALPVLRRGAGIAGAGAAFEAGQRLAGGQRGLTIRVGRNGQQEIVMRRRRINPTNIRALRRAARRIRSFMRATRKVQRLFPARRHVHLPMRRRRYRGDILPFEHDGAINPYAAEDYADYLDEAEDLGFDPGSFQDAEEVAD